jgi:hypothetical protein
MSPDILLRWRLASQRLEFIPQIRLPSELRDGKKRQGRTLTGN